MGRLNLGRVLGDIGPAGPVGPKGDKGDTGEAGPAGTGGGSAENFYDLTYTQIATSTAFYVNNIPTNGFALTQVLAIGGGHTWKKKRMYKLVIRVMTAKYDYYFYVNDAKNMVFLCPMISTGNDRYYMPTGTAVDGQFQLRLFSFAASADHGLWIEVHEQVI